MTQNKRLDGTRCHQPGALWIQLGGDVTDSDSHCAEGSLGHDFMSIQVDLRISNHANLGQIEPDSGERCRSLSVDRNVPDDGGSERLAVPATPTVFQAQSCYPGHEIEFAWPGIAADNREESHALRGEFDVTLVQPLGYRVVAPDIEFYPLELN